MVLLLSERMGMRKTDLAIKEMKDRKNEHLLGNASKTERIVSKAITEKRGEMIDGSHVVHLETKVKIAEIHHRLAGEIGKVVAIDDLITAIYAWIKTSLVD